MSVPSVNSNHRLGASRLTQLLEIRLRLERMKSAIRSVSRDTKEGGLQPKRHFAHEAFELDDGGGFDGFFDAKIGPAHVECGECLCVDEKEHDSGTFHRHRDLVLDIVPENGEVLPGIVETVFLRGVDAVPTRVDQFDISWLGLGSLARFRRIYSYVVLLG